MSERVTPERVTYLRRVVGKMSYYATVDDVRYLLNHIDALEAERDDLRAKVDAVRALADEWELVGRVIGLDSREQHENDALAMVARVLLGALDAEGLA